MKKLIILFAVFTHLNISASVVCDLWSFQNIYSNQTFTSDFNGEIYIDLENVQDALNHGFTFDVSLFDVRMEMYASDPCVFGATVLADIPDASEFYLDTLPAGTKFLKFKQANSHQFKVEIKLDYPPQLPECNYVNNRRNDHENPVLLTDFYPDDYIFEDCNNGCEVYGGPLKYYQMPTANLDFVDIIPLTEDLKIELFGISNGTRFTVGNLFIKEGYLMNVTSWDTIQFALGKVDPDSYSFTLDKFEKDSTCVDFFISGDTLLNLTTPEVLESTIYTPGDTIDFEYRLMSWAPVNYNFFHGLGFSFGNGWKGLALKDGEPDIEYEAHIIGEDSQIQIKELYEDDPDYYFLEDISGDLVIPGLYFNNEASGPVGPNSSFYYGIPFDTIVGSFEAPIFKLKFSLIVSDDVPCDSIVDGSFTVRALSDYESGREDSKGCFDHDIITTPNYEIDNCIISSSNNFASADSNGYTFYPNPTRDILNIDSQNHKITSVKVFDLNGRNVINEKLTTMTNIHQLNLSELPSGIYYIRIVDEVNDTDIKKILVH